MKRSRPSKPTRIKCKCGIQVKNSPLALGRHDKSVFHNDAKRIKALIEQDDLTFLEISRRIGISPEGVRQISFKLGKTGQQRLADERLKQKRLRLCRHPLMKKTAEMCQTLNLTFEPLNRHAALINGHHCLIYRCWEATKHNHKYFRVRAPKSMHGDYLILWIRNLSFVFPKNKVARETFFTIYPLPTGGKKARHDYTNFVEAWSQLSVMKKADKVQ